RSARADAGRRRGRTAPQRGHPLGGVPQRRRRQAAAPAPGAPAGGRDRSPRSVGGAKPRHVAVPGSLPGAASRHAAPVPLTRAWTTQVPGPPKENHSMSPFLKIAAPRPIARAMLGAMLAAGVAGPVLAA